MKILIIEDEANIIQVIRLYLEQAGYSVLSASDGIAGLELHAREHPDLVILDLMLPGLEGWRFVGAFVTGQTRPSLWSRHAREKKTVSWTGIRSR